MHFQIHNGARDIETRTARAQRPTHAGLTQFIMNGTRRLIRGRPVVVSEEQLKQYIEELRAKEKEGILYVTTLDGREVNLYDEALPAAPAAPAPNPRPEPPLDSAANDAPHGVEMNANPGEAPPPKEFTMPVEPPVAAVENNPAAPVEETLLAETPAEGVPSLDVSSLIGSDEPLADGAVVQDSPVEPVAEVKEEETAPAPVAELVSAEAPEAEAKKSKPKKGR